jgi:hypothetical protein
MAALFHQLDRRKVGTRDGLLNFIPRLQVAVRIKYPSLSWLWSGSSSSLSSSKRFKASSAVNYLTRAFSN